MQPVSPPPLAEPLAEPWSVGKLGRLLLMFGPAAIVASVSIGAGETIIVVRTGAWMGYGLLWLILLSVLVKGVCVTYYLGRYTAITGEAPGSRLVRLPGPRGWLLAAIVFLELGAAGPLWGALARPSGELVGYLLFGSDAGSSAPWLATVFVGAALAMSLPASYRFIERQQVVICAILVAGTVIGTALVRPDLTEVLRGLVAFGSVPRVPSTAPAEFQQNVWPLLAVTFGYVGGSVMTYLVYPDFIIVRGWGMAGHPQIEDIRRRAAEGAPRDYLPRDAAAVAQIRRAAAPVRWDVTCGAAVLLVVSASFMIAGAAVLLPRHSAAETSEAFSGWNLLTDQAWIWRHIHPALVWVYYITVVAALWGTLQAYPDIYARGITEYARAIWPQRRWSQQQIQLGVCLYVFVAAAAVIWSGINFDTMTAVVSFLATNLGVALAMFAGLYLNFCLPKAYRTRWWMLIGGVMSAGTLAAAAAVSGWTVWRQFTAALSW